MPVSPGMQFVLATRHLERIADHATNIAEDIIFWVRGLDVRHGRGRMIRSEVSSGVDESTPSVTDNSQAVHSPVTPECDAQSV